MFFSVEIAHALVALSTLIVPHVNGANLKDAKDTPPASKKIPIPRQLQSNPTRNWGSMGEIFGTFEDDRSGAAIALDGTGRRMVVGSPYAMRNNPYRNYHTGIVQVLEQVEDTPTWIQLGEDIVGISGNDQFGMEVSISEDGNRVAALAPGYDIDEDDEAIEYYAIGRVRVFDYIDGNWTQVGALTEVKAAIMSADGRHFVVGHPEDTGRAGVFDFDGTTFTQLGGWINADTEGDSFGEAVAISYDGSRIAVGARLNDVDGWVESDDDYPQYDDSLNPFPSCYDKQYMNDKSANFGLVRVYEFGEEENDWVQLGSDIEGAPCDMFGSSIDMSRDGSRIIVGASEGDVFDRTDDAYEDRVRYTMAGRVRVLDYTDGSWTDVGQEIEGEARFQRLGRSVSISADGGRIVVGSETGWVQGPEEYPVCVYDLVEEEWETIGECILAPDGGDDCGVVAMDDTGSVVAIGCDNISQLVRNVGGVRVYSQMDECVSEQNNVRLQKVDELVVEHGENKIELEQKQEKSKKRTRKKFYERERECENNKCRERVSKKKDNKLKNINAKFQMKGGKNTDKFWKEERNAVDMFMEMADECE